MDDPFENTLEHRRDIPHEINDFLPHVLNDAHKTVVFIDVERIFQVLVDFSIDDKVKDPHDPVTDTEKPVNDLRILVDVERTGKSTREITLDDEIVDADNPIADAEKPIDNGGILIDVERPRERPGEVALHHKIVDPVERVSEPREELS